MACVQYLSDQGLGIPIFISFATPGLYLFTLLYMARCNGEQGRKKRLFKYTNFLRPSDLT